jgi:adenine deaminase
LKRKEIKYLSEMMNFPGVIYDDITVHEKIKIARDFGKPIDGHAPGVTGESLKKYILAGITTDHECSSIEEAREKIGLGMKILIREGSAARNLDSLKDLYRTNPQKLMLCSDDIHPEMLQKRHINKLVSRLINEGYDIFDVVRSCTMNPVNHYGLEAGLLRPGDSADFIIVDDPTKMNIKETWIQGKKVFENGKVCFSYSKGEAINNFNCSEVDLIDISRMKLGRRMKVIEASNGELLTSEYIADTGDAEFIASIPSKDILKIIVKDRYNDMPSSVGFIKGFGLKEGAFASSVAHDSHNIICVGADDVSMVNCINEIVRLKGGLAVSSSGKINSLQLNIGGIMSDDSCSGVANKYEELTSLVIKQGCTLSAPFMTLSFMALLVIPILKISDRGLFDVNKFSFTSLFAD